MIKSIKFISVPVADQKRALEFYTTKLGFSVFTNQPFGESQRWIELQIGNAPTKLVLFTPDGDKDLIGRRLNASFSVDNLDKTYAQLREAGVEFLGPPTKQEWGSYAILVDSEGNKLLISED